MIKIDYNRTINGMGTNTKTRNKRVVKELFQQIKLVLSYQIFLAIPYLKVKVKKTNIFLFSFNILNLLAS